MTIAVRDLDAERATLGAILQSRDALLQGIDELTARDFSHEPHARLFQAVASLHSEGRGIDVLTVTSHLRSVNKLDEIGGELTIEKCVQSVPSIDNAAEYVATVKDRAFRRRLTQAMDRVTRAAHSEPSIDALLAIAEREVASLHSLRGGHLGLDSAASAESYLNSLLTTDERASRFPYPLPTMNIATMGMRRGQLVVGGGRPSDGKSIIWGTQLMLSVLRRKPGAKAVIFAMEMSADEVTERMIQSFGVNVDAFKRGLQAQQDLLDLDTAIGTLKGYDYTIIEGWHSPEETAAIIRRMKPDLAIVDHLHRMVRNDFDLIGKACALLKNIALELRCVVVLASQLRRAQTGYGTTANPRPTMQDLKGASAIEEEADLIALIWREWDGNEQGPGGEVLIAKARGGWPDHLPRRIPVRLDSTHLGFVELEVSADPEPSQEVPV